MTQRPGRAVADLLRRRVLQATIALPALGVRGALAAELGYPRVMQGTMTARHRHSIGSGRV